MRRERSLLIFLAVLSLSLIGYTIVNNYLGSRSQIITWAERTQESSWSSLRAATSSTSRNNARSLQPAPSVYLEELSPKRTFLRLGCQWVSRGSEEFKILGGTSFILLISRRLG